MRNLTLILSFLLFLCIMELGGKLSFIHENDSLYIPYSAMSILGMFGAVECLLTIHDRITGEKATLNIKQRFKTQFSNEIKFLKNLWIKFKGGKTKWQVLKV